MKFPVTNPEDSAQSERVDTLAATVAFPCWSVRVNEGKRVYKAMHVTREERRKDKATHHLRAFYNWHS